jgi:sirohydrochlorin ferrochelatase
MERSLPDSEETVLLVDNGSLRPESVLNLRRLARELGEQTGRRVEPASLLHSSKIDPALLEGVAAVNFERRLRFGLESGERHFTVLPFFFGPSAAITDYMAERIAHRVARHGLFSIARTAFLAGEPEAPELRRLVGILVERIWDAINETGWKRPRVALVDHGSPREAVTRVRDQLAKTLREALGDAVSVVAASSMERRPGPEFAFNDPLLEDLLVSPGWSESEVIVAMQFLSPGRHAGPDGDVAEICARASSGCPRLKTHMTALVGDHPEILPLLKERLAGPRYAL